MIARRSFSVCGVGMMIDDIFNSPADIISQKKYISSYRLKTTFFA